VEGVAGGGLHFTGWPVHEQGREETRSARVWYLNYGSSRDDLGNQARTSSTTQVSCTWAAVRPFGASNLKLSSHADHSFADPVDDMKARTPAAHCAPAALAHPLPLRTRCALLVHPALHTLPL